MITNGNKARVVEVLRSIAELMIWGDQHSPAFFGQKRRMQRSAALCSCRVCLSHLYVMFLLLCA